MVRQLAEARLRPPDGPTVALLGGLFGAGQPQHAHGQARPQAPRRDACPRRRRAARTAAAAAAGARG